VPKNIVIPGPEGSKNSLGSTGAPVAPPLRGSRHIRSCLIPSSTPQYTSEASLRSHGRCARGYGEPGCDFSAGGTVMTPLDRERGVSAPQGRRRQTVCREVRAAHWEAVCALGARSQRDSTIRARALGRAAVTVALDAKLLDNRVWEV